MTAIVLKGDQVQGARALTIAAALKLYAKTGMKPNRAYTPTNMLRAAEQITGKKFKRGQYLQAADALREYAGVKTEGAS